MTTPRTRRSGGRVGQYGRGSGSSHFRWSCRKNAVKAAKGGLPGSPAFPSLVRRSARTVSSVRQRL